MMQQQQPEMLADVAALSPTSVEAALARIDEKLAAGERRFDSFDQHVRDCATDKQALRDEVKVLTGKLDQMDKAVLGLRVAVFAFLGSVLVAGAIALKYLLDISEMVAAVHASMPGVPMP